jgi:2-phospho-L-lactate guanylyltransferase
VVSGIGEYGGVRAEVDLVVPVKTLDRAKSRLVGAADRGAGNPVAHAALALALALDTIAAVCRTDGVRHVLVVTSDPAVTSELRVMGVESVPEPATGGLNPALGHGAAVLRQRDPLAAIGALQADLPALRPAELSAAITQARGRRAFCADRQGTGTTLLVAAPGTGLRPRFGSGSASAHAASDAVELTGAWPSLRCDVDTAEDLSLACALGLGSRTAALLDTACARP